MSFLHLEKVHKFTVPPAPKPSWFAAPNYPKKLEYIMIHTSASPVDMTPQRLVDFFLKDLKWSKTGYNFYITQDGSIYQFYDINADGIIDWTEVTWGEPEVNYRALHVCYSGGVVRKNNTLIPADTRTPAQRESMIYLIKTLLTYFPFAKVVGHNQFRNKACPSFFVPKWAKFIGIEDKNIDFRDPFGYSKIY